jgi:hypothetical protein
VPEIVPEGDTEEVSDCVGVGVGVARLVAVLDGVRFGVPDTEGVPVIVEVDVMVLLAV